MISLALYGGSAFFYLLSFILLVAEISKFMVAITKYDDTSLSVFDRLTGFGITLLVIALLASIAGAYFCNNGGLQAKLEIISAIMGFIPALAANNIDDITKLDSDATTQFGATAIWIGVLLALGAFIAIKFMKK